MSQPKIRTARTPAGPLPDMPIDPAWVREGAPVARGTILLQSDDKKVSSGFWECSEGKFEWHFSWDEFIRVIDGQVEIREESGATHALGPGDTAHFPLGLKTFWHVTKPVRKFFVIRTPEPLNL